MLVGFMACPDARSSHPAQFKSQSDLKMTYIGIVFGCFGHDLCCSFQDLNVAGTEV